MATPDERGAQIADEHAGYGLFRSQQLGSQRVTYVELFFDLVFVFAVTQLSHHLLEHLSVRGALQTLLLLFAVWMAWCYTAWVTNWLDPDTRPVRIMLFVVMLINLIMAAALPEAFGDRALVFASAYVAVQVGRSLFVTWAMRSQLGLYRNFQRVTIWCAFSGTFWLAGGLTEGATREALWLTAILVECAGPVCGFFLPWLGRSYTYEWTISGGNFAERFQLFIILALGESIVVTGRTFGDLEWTGAIVAAFVTAFVGSIAFWWIYFSRSADASNEVVEASDDPGRLGRSAYTYFHIPMVAGIIVAAVGDELSIAHPNGHADTATVAVILGGPTLFLLGHMLFKRSVFGVWSTSRLAALVTLAVIAPFGTSVSPLAVALAATLVVVGVALWDAWLTRHGAYHGVPTLAAED